MPINIGNTACSVTGVHMKLATVYEILQWDVSFKSHMYYIILY